MVAQGLLQGGVLRQAALQGLHPGRDGPGRGLLAEPLVQPGLELLGGAVELLGAIEGGGQLLGALGCWDNKVVYIIVETLFLNSK